jgi:hypothetical protein
MKRLLILLLGLLLVFYETIAQTVDISCKSTYPWFPYGYLNYRAFALGTVFEITFKRNPLGKIQWDVITDIRSVGRVHIEKANLGTIVPRSDSIMQALIKSGAYNIGLNLNINDDTVTKVIHDAVFKELNFVLVHPGDSSILDINAVRKDLWALELPPLKKKNTLYAICNRVIYSDSLLLGFVRDGNFSPALSIDVPNEDSETRQVIISNSCHLLGDMVGKTYGFFTFVGITDNGVVLDEYQGEPNEIIPVGTGGGKFWGNYALNESSSNKKRLLFASNKNAGSRKDTPKFKALKNSEKKNISFFDIKSSRSKK